MREPYPGRISPCPIPTTGTKKEAVMRDDKWN
jgi:hypothetical protein